MLTDPDGAARPCAARRPGARPRRTRATCSAPSAALVYGDPTAHLAVLGVTGTSGKTTVAHMVEAGLDAAGRTAGLLGTVGIRIDGARLPSAFTTPEAPDLQALFAVMRESGVTDVAMEVSSHALALGRVAGTRFAVGAFTNLSQDHLDFHRDMEDYFAAKATLFDGRAEHAVICVDDEWGVRLAARTPGAVTVADDGPRRLVAPPTRRPKPTAANASPRCTPGGAIPVRLRLPGAFNVANALVALACLAAVGVPPAVAAERFAEVTVPGRMQRIDARPAVPRGGRLRAQARRRRRAAGHAARPGARTADHRSGLRRRPRPRQAPAHGGRRGAPLGRPGGHRRQPALGAAPPTSGRRCSRVR